MSAIALAFVCGLAYEGICTAWVTYVEDKRVLKASVTAFLAAAAVASGIGESIQRPSALIAYALGCSVGSAAVLIYPRVADWLKTTRRARAEQVKREGTTP